MRCEWPMKIRKQRLKKQRRDRRGILLLALLFFFLFPYAVSNFSGVEKQEQKSQQVSGEVWVLEENFWGNQKILLEEYLKGMVAATIPAEYHLETLKAQAVILRTYCMNKVEKKDGEKIIRDSYVKELYFTQEDCKRVWKDSAEEKRNKIEQAVRETKGVILVCNGTIPELPFCRMSNGTTRDMEEYTVKKEKFQFMKMVSCPDDIMAENYIQYVELSTEEFQGKIKKLLEEKNIVFDKLVLYRDSAEYVKEVEVGEYKIDGEKFKKAFGLASSCFSLDRIDHKIQIQTKGIGHGFGFSQYSANLMAENGKDYLGLLEYFFQNIVLERI